MHNVRVKPNTPKINSHLINDLLADPMRLQILAALGQEDLSLEELGEILKKDLQRVKKQVSVLLSAHLIRKSFHRGKSAYEIADRQLNDVWNILYKLWSEEVSSPVTHKVLAL